MRALLGVVLATMLLFVLTSSSQAGDSDAKSILDKAITALGGAEKLAKIEAFSMKAKGTVVFNGNESDTTTEVIFKGLDHYRREFGNDQFHGVVVLDGTKGWRKFGDNSSTIEGDAVANEKRTIYLSVIPITLVSLKNNGFKYEAAGEEKVGDKPAVILKVTGPDGKDFTLSFDKESGLPVKQVAKVVGFQGQEYTLESTFADYKDFSGIKKATKIQTKRDGEKFQDLEVTEFKVLDKVDPDAFAEPK
jgi:outer membrane lipoprotein-sorting protein